MGPAVKEAPGLSWLRVRGSQALSRTKGESIPGERLPCAQAGKASGGDHVEQGADQLGAKCRVPGNEAQALDSCHKNPKLHCPPSSAAGFCPAFSLRETLGAARDWGPLCLSGGDRLGQGTHQG